MTIPRSAASLLAATALCLATALGGCGSPAQDSSTTTSAESQDAATTDTGAVEEPDTTTQDSAGTASKPATDAVSVTMRNETGYDVVSISLRAAGQDTYDARHTFEGIALPNGESTTIEFAPIMDGGEPASAYDVLATTTNGAIVEIRNVNLVGVTDLTLRFEDSIGYATYTDPQTNETVDNREESEQAIHDAADDEPTYDMLNQMDVPE